MKRNFLKPLISFIFILTGYVSTLAASDISPVFRFFDSNELSSTLITDIAQDAEGYVWIATEYGLNRFDGIRFVHYNSRIGNQRSLRGDKLARVFTDNHGRVWVTSYDALQRFEPATDDFSTAHLGKEIRHILDAVPLKGGNIAVLREDALYIVDPSKMQSTPVKGSHAIMEKHSPKSLFADSNGTLWLGARRKVISLKDEKFRVYPLPEMEGKEATKFAEDRGGNLYVASYQNLMRFDRAADRFRNVMPIPQELSGRRLYTDSKDNLLLGSFSSGIYKIDVNRKSITQTYRWTEQTPPYDKQKISAFLEDRDGNIWLGCSLKGVALLQHHPLPFRYLPASATGVSNDGLLRNCFVDPHGRLFIAQEMNGILQIDPSTGKATGHYLPGVTVLSGTADNDLSHYWLGTFRKGLARVSREGGNIDWICPDGRVSDVKTTPDGRIFAAFFNDGLKAYDQKTLAELPLGGGKKLKLHNRYLNTLHHDDNGILWIGHYYGFDAYDLKHDRLLDVPTDTVLRKSIVNSITTSPDGRVWFGSSTGLYSYDLKSERWQRFSTDDGLVSDYVSGVVADRRGAVWASTFHGVSRINLADGKIDNFLRSRGMPNTSFSPGAAAISPTGNLYFGSEDGVTEFNPTLIKGNSFQRGPLLTGLIVDGKAEPLRVLHFGHGDSFVLQFAPMDFRDMENVYLEYCFDPKGEKDEKWVCLPAGSTEIPFLHLSSGKHKMLVRFIENGVASPVTEFSIHVAPPWYATWWAYLIYGALALLIASLIFLVYRHRTEARTNEEKIRFFVDISHELRSPLTLIKSPLEALVKVEKDSSKIHHLNAMQKNTDRLLVLVDQILSIRKIEKGQTRMHFARTEILPFVQEVCSSFLYETERRGISLEIHAESADGAGETWIDRDYFDKIITNLVGNALKYVADKTGVIGVNVSFRDGHCLISVTDNGPGIDEDRLRSIFQRFYQAGSRSSGGRIGYGIGLNLSAKLAELHGGSISARNRTDGQSGSVFTVEIPLGNAHLRPSQLVDESFFAPETKVEEIVDSLPLEEPATEETEPLVTDADAPRRARHKTTYHVAVVDDDEEIRNFLMTELSESYNVHLFSNGQEALEGIVDLQPDIVVSDVKMPVMDGFTLLRRLKSNTKTSHIPVILLTSKSDHGSHLEGIGKGADAYVDKPFSLELFEVRIAALIANRLLIKGKFSGAQEQEESIKQIELAGNNKRLLDKISATVSDRLSDEEFNVEALADAVGLSRAQLHRKVKELTGLTVGEFIRNQRLQQAARLLAQGDTTVSQVTYAVGLTNPTHFATAFKKYFGVTPSAYMDKHSGKQAENSD